MGRVIRSERLALGHSPRQRLVLLAAATQAGLSPAEMEGRLQVCGRVAARPAGGSSRAAPARRPHRGPVRRPHMAWRGRLPR
jgi:hypothetical protein